MNALRQVILAIAGCVGLVFVLGTLLWFYAPVSDAGLAYGPDAIVQIEDLLSAHSDSPTNSISVPARTLRITSAFVDSLSERLGTAMVCLLLSLCFILVVSIGSILAVLRSKPKPIGPQQSLPGDHPKRDPGQIV